MEENSQSRGLGSFFFAAIPWVLGMGALTWLAFYTGIVTFHHEQKQIKKAETIEQRMDGRVGSEPEPTEPVTLIFHGKGCIKVDRAYLDDTNLTVYLHNACHRKITDISYDWKGLAPDGTTIESGYHYLSGSDDMDGDEKREESVALRGDDKRVHTILFQISGFNDYNF